MTETGEQFEDQDSEPTSTAPGDKRPQDQSTGSDAGDPKTNIEAEAAAGGGPEMEEGAADDEANRQLSDGFDPLR